MDEIIKNPVVESVFVGVLTTTRKLQQKIAAIEDILDCTFDGIDEMIDKNMFSILDQYEVDYWDEVEVDNIIYDILYSDKTMKDIYINCFNLYRKAQYEKKKLNYGGIDLVNLIENLEMGEIENE